MSNLNEQFINVKSMSDLKNDNLIVIQLKKLRLKIFFLQNTT